MTGDFERWFSRYGDDYETITQAAADYELYLRERDLVGSVMADLRD